MEKISTKQKLTDSWSNFIAVILDPIVLLLIILTVASSWCLTYYSNQPNSNATILTVLSTITTVVSGLAGGLVAAKWTKATEVNVLSEKGKSAIRGLKLILLNVSKIEKRTSNYIQKIDSTNPQYQLIENNFEEIVEKCNIVQEEIISSIENWTDILPDVADIKTQIGIISELKGEKERKEMELNELSEKLKAVEITNVTERDELKAQIKQKSKEIEDKNSKIWRLESENQLSGFTKKSIHGKTLSSLTIDDNINILDPNEIFRLRKPKI